MRSRHETGKDASSRAHPLPNVITAATVLPMLKGQYQKTPFHLFL